MDRWIDFCCDLTVLNASSLSLLALGRPVIRFIYSGPLAVAEKNVDAARPSHEQRRIEWFLRGKTFVHASSDRKNCPPFCLTSLSDGLTCIICFRARQDVFFFLTDFTSPIFRKTTSTATAATATPIPWPRELRSLLKDSSGWRKS